MPLKDVPLKDVPLASSPVLADGVFLDELFDLDYREVSMRVLSDPEIYQLELDRLFPRTWNIVAHEDEIRLPGDYVLRYVGEDEIVVSRAEDGSITAALNVCTHRGARLCRYEKGNALRFTCPYHAWAFRPDGRFLGAPIAREKMHGELRSKEELSLQSARVEQYAGMIFVNFDLDAPSLRDTLGPMTWYWDLMFDRTSAGMTVIGPPQRFTIRANWKTAGEQFAGDIFHTLSLHKSMQELGMLSTDGPVQEPAMAGTSAAHRGSFVRCFDVEEEHYLNALKGRDLKSLSAVERLRMQPPPGMSVDMVDQIVQKFSPEQVEMLAKRPPQVGSFFPNIGGIVMHQPLPDGTLGAFISWRTWVPKGPDRFEVMSWTVAERDSSPELRENVRMFTAATFGVSGFVESDDSDIWPLQQKSARGALGRRQKLRYQTITPEGKPEGWPGPGDIYDGFPKDNTQWAFWTEYLGHLTGRL
ncbi:MAG: aromatic ring-hydroxylating dioxygenase subunit alpha [Actinomycetota bacterium]|nr:aromatic ring-hydroxylating dioxygenase subunit alpha [Actinomycetota bacterium]